VARTIRCAAALEHGREIELLRGLEQKGGLRRPVRAVLAESAMEPGIFGLFRPVLVWPAGISERLDDAHLEAILAHEVCHVRRRDNLLAALNMLVEAVFWFHPLVWWMGARLVAEREHACDEEVLALCARPQVYAESILKVCEFCVESPLECVAGITGADLKRRVVEIMRARALLRLTWPKRALLGAAVLCAIAVPVMMGQAEAAKAEQRLMLAAIQAAPKPLQTAAHAMIEEEQAPSSGEVEKAALPALPAQRDAIGDLDQLCDPALAREPGVRFDVVSIRPVADRPGRLIDPPDGDGLTGEAGTAYDMIRWAFNLGNGWWPLDQVRGAPKGFETDNYDFQAKVAPSDVAAWRKLSESQRQLVFRSVLFERFKLACHVEYEQRSVYNLVIAKGGPKIRESQPEDLKQFDGKGGFDPQIFGVKVYMLGGSTYGFPDVSIRLFADNFLPRMSGRTVIDKTALPGKYTFRLAFTGLYNQATHSFDNEVAAPNAPLLFDALEEQLGLKLVPSKGPVPVLVIDHIEKPTVDGAEVQPTTAPNMMPVSMSQLPPGTVATGTAASGSLAQFDAATIKHHDPNDKNPFSNGQGFRGSPGGRIFFGGPARMLVQFAYGLQDYQVTGGPEWVASERFEINAVPPNDSPSRNIKIANAEPTTEQRQMLQSLLRDRFGLQCHFETKEGEVYILTRGTKPLQLKPTEHPDRDPRAVTFGPLGGFEQRPKGGGAAGGAPQIRPDGTPVALQGTNTTTDYLALRMSRYLEVPVLNQTGIEGSYDFDVPVDGQDQLVDQVLKLPDGLGLKIKRSRGPVQTLVIDHIDHPTEN
jgi:uncharacterized protein (TIGR03435 family)